METAEEEFLSPPWILRPDEAMFWVPVPQAAQMLRVSPVTLYRWRVNGTLSLYGLESYRLGKKIFIKVYQRHLSRLS